MSRRVLFISHDASRTGAPFVLLHLIKWLKNNSDLEFEILIKDDGELRKEFEKLGKTWILNRKQSKRTLAGRIFSRLFQNTIISKFKAGILRLKIRPGRFGLVYSNTITNGDILESLKHSKVLTHVHELGYTIASLGQSNLDKVKRHTTKYIAVAECVEKVLVKKLGIPAESVVIINPFFIPVENLKGNGSKLRKELNIPDDTFVIGGSGNTDWRKGADLFVNIACVFIRKYPGRSIRFIWVGQNSSGVKDFYDRLIYELEKMDIQSTVIFTGLVNNPMDYFMINDVFMLSSREDPFPVAAMENMFLNKPVVCFEGSGGIPELVSDDAGIVVPFMDTEAAAEKIAGLMEDKEYRMKIGRNGHEKVNRQIEYNTICKNIYHEICEML